MDWIAALLHELRNGEPVARVTLAAVRGSAPREAGACMLVGRTRQQGTIGGGHLEFVALDLARKLLEGGEAARLERFPLGASLGQCCGGIVELWFQRHDAGDVAFLEEALAARAGHVIATERTQGSAARMRLLTLAEAESEGALFVTDDIGTRATLVRGGERATLYERIDTSATSLWLFGAGHVGQALVGTLAALPFDITWVDSRDGVFPASLPANVRALHAPQPADEAGVIPAGAWSLVMTHSHDEDFEICRALLAHGRCGWIGLIGSLPKANRFRQRLRHRGFSGDAIARIATPIGIGGIASKEPAAIAVSIAAQLLQLREARAIEARPARAAKD
jgi:xanthine dehydrogenase accessory factor